jgi:FKBP-type peptidyl-prolyl cis-trans isomerase
MAANDKNITPFWLKWLVLAFIIYAGYLNLTGKDAGTAPATTSGTGTAATAPAEVVASVTSTGLSIPNDIEGAGDAAACGQTASVTAKGRTGNGQTVNLPAPPSPVHIGVPAAEQPWLEALVGMKPGGVREVSLGATRLTEAVRTPLKLAEGETLRVMLTLESLTPSVPEGSLPFLATDLATGTGEVASCGRTAAWHLTLWNPDGSLRYSSREAGAPLKGVIGAGTYAYGLDRTLLGMRAGGTRRAILPPAYLAAPENAPALDMPRDQVVIADVQLLTVTDTK